MCRRALVLHSRVEEGYDISEGMLECACGGSFPVTRGIPRLLSQESRSQSADDPQQVRASFSWKWNRIPRWGFDSPRVRAFNREWFHAKLGCRNAAEFLTLIARKKAILDAGTGLGDKVAYMCEMSASALVVGADFSESVVSARENLSAWPNAHIVQSDLGALPFRRDLFDLIVCDGVLHHTPDPPQYFKTLVPFLSPGGEIAIHVYRRLGPIREFCDDLIRKQCMELPPEKAWDFCHSFTRLGETLANVGAIVEVRQDIPALGVQAGRYDLQRFVYQHFFKCFWNADFTFEENNLVNFDWYHPALASRHSEEEVVGWFRASGLMEIRVPRANENGVSVIGRRP